MCFGCSKEQSHQDGSFEYPQHMFWLRNKTFFSVTHSYLGACLFNLNSALKYNVLGFFQDAIPSFENSVDPDQLASSEAR